MTHFYCSIFSKAYAYKGLLLYDSLERWDKEFHFFLICLDREVQDLVMKMDLKNATVIAMADIEADDSQLPQVRDSRNDKEYIWSAKASALLYILNKFSAADHIVWLDGDTCFYADPSPIFAEWGNYSIMLTLERWRKANRDRILTKGRYNTGFMGFKRDTNAMDCLGWFRERLLEWCYDKLENGLWSDQLYVNDWPRRFQNVGVIKNLGVNAGPYIIGGCKVTRVGEEVFLNGERLILYHSYGFRYYDGNEFDLCSYIMSFSDEVLRWIYLPYVQASREKVAQIEEVFPGFYPARRPKHQFIRNYFNLQANALAPDCLNLCTVLSRDYLVQGLALYSSLREKSASFRLWVLCVDAEAYAVLDKLNLKDVIIISLENILNEKLTEIQGQRRLHEFCWTLKPYLVTYILKNNVGMESLLYLDADQYFFRDVREVFQEWGKSPIFLTSLWMGARWSERVGRYSAGLIGFMRNRQGLKVLASWRRNCRDWCYEKIEPKRWGDQKYLDQWPGMLPDLRVTENKGINTGPWNIRKGYSVHKDADGIYFDEYKLICYHFSGFKILTENEFELCNRKTLPGKAVPIYTAYVKAIAKSIAVLRQQAPKFALAAREKPVKLYNHFVLPAEGEHHA